MKKFILVALILLIPATAFAGGRKGDAMPTPDLMTPGDDLVIAGKPEVEFRWSGQGDSTKLQYYDFRLYKGPKGYEPDTIFKQEVPRDRTSVLVKSDLFTVGQTYSWSVRQIGNSSKGRKANSVFKVAG